MWRALDIDRFRALGARQLDDIAARYGLPPDVLESVRFAAAVLPFRVNEYVLAELVDWDRVPDDPMFQLLFPQRGMLTVDDARRLERARDSGSAAQLSAEVAHIRAGLNPHPAGQRQLNVPDLDGVALEGLQHKYRSTVLYFPAHGQGCHSYCTYCFRWPQFVGTEQERFSASGPDGLVGYLRRHPEVTDVLVTGGDPMIMSTERLRLHLEPLLRVGSVHTIRIGTKAISYWPQRFLTDRDADDLLRLFTEVVESGRILAVMAHTSHPREIAGELPRRALSRIRSTGALLFGQAPLIARVNDDEQTWSTLWRTELAAGMVPYYQFVERDTGPHEYFKVSLERAVRIFQRAYAGLPGLARVVRGPVMSTTPGKVLLDGIVDEPDGRYFSLRMIQARDPALVGRPFRARHSFDAAWLDDLDLAPSTPEDLKTALAPATRSGTR
jgi:L-lysine 2,3-aminomutase